jgi:hypothetical protein
LGRDIIPPHAIQSNDDTDHGSEVPAALGQSVQSRTPDRPRRLRKRTSIGVLRAEVRRIADSPGAYSERAAWKRPDGAAIDDVLCRRHAVMSGAGDRPAPGAGIGIYG